MNARTAAELADYARWGIDPEVVDNYRAEYPEQERMSAYLYQAWHLDASKPRDIGTGQHVAAGDEYLYTSRGRDPAAPETEIE